ncbi:amino acid permease [Saccharibacter sp. 17.LH.SD]|uniref:APC family permease n=1 Tax=Saccharibacter sp. 17.LH.SD TaxID=2689393 RepID=UPI001370A756|nr:amino acid permease [Saccharibacter sp. 17.LH.SD]MXV44275.1 amino acid permease [Saccharibacter sp. 17.LH.SD]
MSMPLWRTKPIAPHTDQQDGLKRVFGPWRLIAMGVGVTVGAGLFSLTGVVAGQNAGPAVTLSFLIAAIAASFAGLCYAELSGMIPAGGSAYAYAYAGLGEGTAWIIGWDLILEYTVGAAAVASSWSSYLASLLRGWGIIIDPRLLAPPSTPVTMPDGSTAHAWFNAPSIIIICAITALLMRGTSESARFNTLVVMLKILVITSMVVACVPFIQLSHFHPFIPPNQGEFGHFGPSGILRAAGMAFFAYIGIDIVSTAAQDTRDPQRNMPIGILGSLAACAVIYIIFSTMLVGVVDFHTLANDPSPVATAMDTVHMPWLAAIVKIGVTLGYISGMYGLLIGQSRIALNMARDGLIPPAFGRLNKRSQTPWTAHILTAIASSILAACLPIGALGAMTAIGTLLAFVIVCAGVTALRLRNPDVPRRFRVPGGPFLVPALGILSCGVVMASIGTMTWVRLLIWLVLGLVIYFTYSIKHSHLHNTPSRHNS